MGEEPGPDLFDRALAGARATWSLTAAAAPDWPDLTEREERLVEAALQAGVLGALGAMREDDPEVGSER